MAKRIVLADPRGFCAGVDRAILTVQTILKAASARVDGLPPVYVRRQIVHNRHVVEDLAAQGAVFVQELAEIPDEAAAAGIPIVFSAHGVSPQVKAEAARRGMHVVDATCPLVSKDFLYTFPCRKFGQFSNFHRHFHQIQFQSSYIPPI